MGQTIEEAGFGLFCFVLLLLVCLLSGKEQNVKFGNVNFKLNVNVIYLYEEV